MYIRRMVRFFRSSSKASNGAVILFWWSIFTRDRRDYAISEVDEELVSLKNTSQTSPAFHLHIRSLFPVSRNMLMYMKLRHLQREFWGRKNACTSNNKHSKLDKWTVRRTSDWVDKKTCQIYCTIWRINNHFDKWLNEWEGRTPDLSASFRHDRSASSR